MFARVAKREHFFEVNWWFLFGLLFALASAWLAQGPVFVLVVAAVTAAGIGVYYLIWKLLRDRGARRD
ncbi:MAG: hypothetical protein JWQ32_1216 [Marmoricola sp.]|nr:hypothetical protein [Marmoricola sp.]